MKKALFCQWIALGIGLNCFVGASCAELPKAFSEPFVQAGINPDDVALWVAPAGKTKPRVAHNEKKAMKPASTVKVVTAVAAFDLLGPDYRWKTRWLAGAMPDKNGTVSDLIFQGGGDPYYVIERLWLAAERLKNLGVRAVRGDIGVDRRLFDVRPDASFSDGQKTRSYNVRADAAQVGFRSVCLEITPMPEIGVARIGTIPRLDSFRVTSEVPLRGGTCGNWKRSLSARIDQKSVRFSGTFPTSCGPKIWPMTLWTPDAFLQAVFSHVFSEVGIRWNGSVKPVVKTSAHLTLLTEDSEPLSRLAVLMNKYSNNPMADHLFLSLSFADARGQASPASYARSRGVLAAWLNGKGINGKGLYIENGSGLSRKTRISAEALGHVISYGLTGPYGAEFLAGLPIAGVDGTMKARALTGFAHLKTGRIDGVRSVAGVLRDRSGKDWVVVILVNSKAAQNGIAAIDAVLNYIGSGALHSEGPGARLFLSASRLKSD